MKYLKLILASGSARRKDLLSTIGIQALVVPSQFDEKCFKYAPMDAEELVTVFAKEKTADVVKRYPQDVVLGADTVVVLDSFVFGKPASFEDAERMLKKLSGKTHEVYTGIALYEPFERKTYTKVDRSLVTIRKMRPCEIEWYVSTGEPLGKAGGYAIQGKAALFVTEIKGDYTSIIGLPLPKFYEILKEARIDIVNFIT